MSTWLHNTCVHKIQPIYKNRAKIKKPKRKKTSLLDLSNINFILLIHAHGTPSTCISIYSLLSMSICVCMHEIPGVGSTEEQIDMQFYWEKCEKTSFNCNGACECILHMHLYTYSQASHQHTHIFRQMIVSSITINQRRMKKFHDIWISSQSK